MSESGAGAKSRLDFFEGLDVLRSKLDRIAFCFRRGKIVSRGRQYCRVCDEVTIKVDESEKQLNFANCSGFRPVSENLQLRGLWRHSGSRDQMAQIQDLIAKQGTRIAKRLKGRQFGARAELSSVSLLETTGKM